MATVLVKYSVEITEKIEWPDDEMDEFTYENLECNLNTGSIEKEEYEVDSISSVKVNGEEFEF